MSSSCLWVSMMFKDICDMRFSMVLNFDGSFADISSPTRTRSFIDLSVGRKRKRTCLFMIEYTSSIYIREYAINSNISPTLN